MRDHLPGHLLFIALLLCFSLPCSAPAAGAGEALSVQAEEGLNPQARGDEAGMPRHETEGFFSLGYRYFSLHDSEKASEHQAPHSSLAGEIDLASYPLPHRFHLTSEYLSTDNFYGDAGYAYGDLLLLRNVLTGGYHKLDGYSYNYAGEAPAIAYDSRSTGAPYHLGVLDNSFALRFKAPDFPLHTFLKHRYLAKDGLLQQRFVIGSMGSLQKVSQAREIDWQSNAVTLGANTHLGPVEAEYFCEFSQFDPGRNNTLYDAYPAATARPADTYAHDVVPETESAQHSLRLHSSHTGRLVTAATLSTNSQKNNFSASTSETWQGVFDLSYMLAPELTFFFKYRHRNLEVDNPETITLRGLATTTVYPVRPGISSENDLFSLSARYRPAQKVTITSDYEFTYRERSNTEAWPLLPERTASNRIKLAAQASPLWNLKLKLSTDYRFVHDPAWNVEPDYTNQVKFLTTYLPASWLTAFFSYNRTMTERDHVRYLNNTPNVVLDGGNRETEHDRFLASLSFLFSPRITLTTSFARYHGRVEQDLAYGRWNTAGTAGDLPFLDPAVPYTDEADNYSLSLFYVLREGLTVMTNLSHTESAGTFSPGLAEAQNPVSLGAFSQVKVSETAWGLELTQALRDNWEIGFEFHSAQYNDRYDGSQDGQFYTSTCRVKRHF